MWTYTLAPNNSKIMTCSQFMHYIINACLPQDGWWTDWTPWNQHLMNYKNMNIPVCTLLFTLPFQPKTFLANSMTATCIPRQTPIVRKRCTSNMNSLIWKTHTRTYTHTHIHTLRYTTYVCVSIHHPLVSQCSNILHDTIQCGFGRFDLMECNNMNAFVGICSDLRTSIIRITQEMCVIHTYKELTQVRNLLSSGPFCSCNLSISSSGAKPSRH